MLESNPLEKYNHNKTAVKRLMREFKDLQDEPSDQYAAEPLESNLFEWHFTIRGPTQTPFEGGIYHGRILLPFEYPFKPPSILLLTPNGRFETNKKICLSISNYHPEHWQPCWSIRTVLVALRAFMPTKGEGALGALDYEPEERRVLATASRAWYCSVCEKRNNECILSEGSIDKPLSPATQQEEAAAKEICFKVQSEKERADEAAAQAAKAPSRESQREESDQPLPSSSLSSQQPDESNEDEINEFVDAIENDHDALPPQPAIETAPNTTNPSCPRISTPDPVAPPSSSPRLAKSAPKVNTIDIVLMLFAAVLVAVIAWLAARKFSRSGVVGL